MTEQSSHEFYLAQKMVNGSESTRLSQFLNSLKKWKMCLFVKPKEQNTLFARGVAFILKYEYRGCREMHKNLENYVEFSENRLISKNVNY